MKPTWKTGMSAQEWLYFATLNMPTGIRERVRAETLAHLDEAGALHSADVSEFLGSPQRINRELRRLYLTDREWQNYESACEVWTPVAWLTLVLWPMLLIWAQIKGTPATLTTSQVLPFILLLISVGLFAISTQKLHPIRRRNWRNTMVVLSGLAVQWPYFMQAFNMPATSGMQSTFAILVLILAMTLLRSIRRDQRLNRTMKVEGYSTETK